MTEVPGGARFNQAGGLREGYDRSEVDAFVAELERALADGRVRRTPQVSAAMVREQRFTTRRFGASYDMDEVDVYLEESAVELDRIWQRLGLSAPEATAAPSPAGAELEMLRWFTVAPRGERFPRSSRLLQGYDPEDVDGTVDRVTDAVLGTRGASISRSELEQATFGTCRNGYDMRAVDEWIDGTTAWLDGPRS